MIDFGKYSVGELQAINDVLYDLQFSLWDNDMEWGVLHNLFFRSCMELHKAIDQQAREHAGSEHAAAAADPPAPPDMFGWVGDALDDLCAAGEVLGSDE